MTGVVPQPSEEDPTSHLAPDSPRSTATSVTLYTSSASGSAKTSSDTRRLVHLLRAHGRLDFRLVDLADDTSTTPSDRLEMLTASDCIDTLPQLHVDGKFIGLADDIQEMEDFGELKRVLAGENLEAIIESTKRAIELRLLEEREWSAKKIVARKSGVGISASSLVKDLSRRNTPTQKDLEF